MQTVLAIRIPPEWISDLEVEAENRNLTRAQLVRDIVDRAIHPSGENQGIPGEPPIPTDPDPTFAGHRWKRGA